MASIYDLSAHINLSTLHLGLYGSLVIYRYIYIYEQHCNQYIHSTMQKPETAIYHCAHLWIYCNYKVVAGRLQC